MSQNAELKKLLYRAFKASSATRLTRTVQGLAIMGTAVGLALILLGSSIVDGFQWEIPQKMGQFWGHLQVFNLRSEEDALDHTSPSVSNVFIPFSKSLGFAE
ncbi:MAG: hypothetical protein ACKOHH_09470 [Bacteroidota bacterium]